MPLKPARRIIPLRYESDLTDEMVEANRNRKKEKTK